MRTAGDLQRSAQSFAAAALFGSVPVIVAGDGRPPERVGGTFVSAGAFGLIGTQPALGRDFSAEDARPGAAAVAILGSTLWESRYGADRGILGRSILVNAAPATIVGVMPASRGFRAQVSCGCPCRQMPGLATEQRDARTLRLFARLR